MSHIENGYCPLNGHGLYGGKDRDCPWCSIAKLEAELDRVRELPDKWREQDNMKRHEYDLPQVDDCANELQSALGDEND
jgi:hypothetical protein